MTAWFKSNKEETSDTNKTQPSQTSPGQPSGNGEEQPGITVTDAARDKIIDLIRGAESPVLGIRVMAEGSSPINPEFSLAFVQEGEDFEDDTVIDFNDFKVYIDADSLSLIDGVRLDFVMSGAAGGFRIDKPLPKEELEGPVAEKLQRVIDEQINPALALHGGFVQLIDVKDSTAYIELGGGCKGCGMVDVTLKQGIEVMIKQSVPEITEILDSTDHASGQNPYYQPSK